jgi:uncharacterized protein YlxW (UPF0749 family)
MNLVGKIFVVLIFVMSLVFMSFAVMVYSTHRNWNEEITRKGGSKPGYQEQLQKAREENAQLRAEKRNLRATLDAELVAKTQALGKLESELKIVNQQLAELNKTNEDKGKQLAAAADGLKIAQDNLTNLRKEVETLRAEIRTVHGEADKQFARATELTDKLHNAAGQLQTLSERNKQLATDVARYRSLLNANNIPTNTPADAKPPRVAGVVRQVTGADSIAVSLGSDDGIREGHRMNVVRGDKYLATVQIEKTDPHRSIATVLRETKQGQILEGDRVVTAQ